VTFSLVFRVEEPVMSDESVQFLKEEGLGEFVGWLHKEREDLADAAEFLFEDLGDLLVAVGLLLYYSVASPGAARRGRSLGQIEVTNLEVLYGS
jgi:hypothetical protein